LNLLELLFTTLDAIFKTVSYMQLLHPLLPMTVWFKTMHVMKILFPLKLYSMNKVVCQKSFFLLQLLEKKSKQKSLKRLLSKC